MDGYAGTLHYVDLTRGTLEPRSFPEDLRQKYLGCRGPDVRLITDPVNRTTVPLGAADYAAMLSGMTDQTVTAADQFMVVGEWIGNLQKFFTIRAGFTRADDTLPRFLHEPLQEGAPRGRVWELGSMLDHYYAVRSRDSEGRPTPQTLQGLGI